MQKGILYIVASPIGNLEDITLRAVEILKSVDYILSEDTRETEKMLKRYQIIKSQISYRDQNHDKIIDQILNMLAEGLNLALVSDSGTPIISDPGYKLINKVIERGFDLKTLPGPSSITSALSISGLPTDKFSFLGFLPKSSVAQTKIILDYGKLDSTLVIFESPFRIVKLLQLCLTNLGDRYCAVAAELTKSYERVYRGKISDVIASLEKSRPRGEFVVLIAKENYKN